MSVSVSIQSRLRIFWGLNNWVLYVWEVEGDGNAGDGVGAQFLMRPHGHASAGVSRCLVREQLLLRVETGSQLIKC